jgi:heat shock protein HslJ
MNNFFRTITTGIVLIGAACSRGSDVPAVPDEIDIVSLAGSEWVLQAFGPEDEEVVAAAPAITVMFGADSTFAGSAGCNRYFGRFLTPGGDSLAMGDAGSTMMACPEPAMAQEYRYLQSLGKVGRYRVVAGELVLLDEAGQLLHFVRGPADK